MGTFFGAPTTWQEWKRFHTPLLDDPPNADHSKNDKRVGVDKRQPSDVEWDHD